MRKLLASAVILCLALSAAIFATYGVGHLQPAPAAIDNFHLEDCEIPCWAEINLGKTSLRDTNVRLNALPGVLVWPKTDDFTQRISLYIGSQPVEGLLYLDRASVSQIAIIYQDIQNSFTTHLGDLTVMPTLGDIFDVYGTPSCIDVFQAKSTATLLYPRTEGSLLVTVSTARIDRIQPGSPVISLSYQKASNNVCDRATYPTVRDWRGFTSLERYQNLP